MSYFITSKIGITAQHSRFILPGKKLCGIRSVILGDVHGTASESHPNMRVVQSCLKNVSPFLFWSLVVNQFPDIVSRIHVQVRLMGNSGLNGSLPWLQNTDGAICFICKEDIESVTHFFLDCSYFRNNFESLWDKLKIKIARSNPIDGAYICNFIKN